jgi:hypothetical protein
MHSGNHDLRGARLQFGVMRLEQVHDRGSVRAVGPDQGLL